MGSYEKNFMSFVNFVRYVVKNSFACTSNQPQHLKVFQTAAHTPNTNHILVGDWLPVRQHEKPFQYVVQWQ